MALITQFLNVDLDLKAGEDFDVLTAELSRKLIALHVEKRLASFELRTQPRNIDAAIKNFARVIAGLAPKARRAWKRCASRTFDIGFQCGRAPHSASYRISRDAQKTLARLDADLAVTLYGLTPAASRFHARLRKRRSD